MCCKKLCTVSDLHGDHATLSCLSFWHLQMENICNVLNADMTCQLAVCDDKKQSMPNRPWALALKLTLLTRHHVFNSV